MRTNRQDHHQDHHQDYKDCEEERTDDVLACLIAALGVEFEIAQIGSTIEHERAYDSKQM